MRVYYAHCLAIYHTPQEQRDLVTLRSLGFEVIDPNTPEVQGWVNVLKNKNPDTYMDLFKNFVTECDAVAFRGLPDGAIPAGVAKEVEWAIEFGKPVIELPSSIKRRVMSLEHTREYLHEVGQR